MSQAFDWAEEADWLIRQTAILGRDGLSPRGAVHVGGEVVQNAAPDLNVLVAAGACTDPTGREVSWDSQQLVDCSVDYLSNSTAVVAPGDEKYLGLFAIWDRNLTDPVSDGNGLTVYFQQFDSFVLNIVQGADATGGSAVPPAAPTGGIRLANILLDFGKTSILNADIEFDIAGYFRDDYVRVTGVNLSNFIHGNAADALNQLFGYVDDNSTGALIDFTGNKDWHDASGFLSSLYISPAINEIVEDLAEDNTGAGGEWGSDKVGSDEYATTYSNMDLTRGSISDQLREIADGMDTFIDGFESDVADKVAASALMNWTETGSLSTSVLSLIWHEATKMIVGFETTLASVNAVGFSWAATPLNAPTGTFFTDCVQQSQDGSLVAIDNLSYIYHTIDPTIAWTPIGPATIGGSGNATNIHVKKVAGNWFTSVVRTGGIRFAPTGWASGTWLSPTVPPSITTKLILWMWGGGAINLDWIAVSSSGEVSLSFDDCDNWAAATGDATAILDEVFGIAHRTGTGTVIMCGKDSSNVAIFARSTDYGDTWSEPTIEYAADVTDKLENMHDIKWVRGDVWIACSGIGSAAACGVFVSIDNGATWTWVLVDKTTARDMYCIALDGTKAFMAGDTGDTIRSHSYI